MDLDLFEKILNLFDKIQLSGKPFEINIDQDLLTIIPLPRKLILDLLSDEKISKIFYLSQDQNKVYFENNFSLCSIDQKSSGSCKSLSCQQLHICKDYILNKNCLELDKYGKCSHSHSLSTKHNHSIINQYNLSLDDNETTFQFISHLIQISLSIKNQSRLFIETNNQQSITDDLIDIWLNDHKSLLIHYRLINPYTIQFIFDDDEVCSMMEDFIIENHRENISVKKNLSFNDIYLNNSKINENNFNKQSKINSIENNNQPIELTNNNNISPTFNHEKNKSGDENRFSSLFGRSRGRNQLNKTPPSPSLSNNNSFSSFNNQSNLNNQNLYSNQQLLSNNSTTTTTTTTSNQRKFQFSQRLNSRKNDLYSQEIKPITINNKTNPTSQINNNEKNFISDEIYHQNQNQSQSNSSLTSYSTNIQLDQNNQYHIDDNNYNNKSPSNDDSSEIDSSENASSVCADVDSKIRFVLRGHEKKTKEKSSVRITNETLMNYVYKKEFNDQQLSYLLGPGRKNLNENDQCQIFPCLPSGYCRVKNIEQGKDIEKQLYSILPHTFNIETVKVDDHLALIICSSAAEFIFQQSQIHYAIITEPAKVHLTIDVIHQTRSEARNSSPILSENKRSSSIDDKTSEQLSLDGKFHISSTGSSIDVISGDISQIPVDMMICVSTSNNLRDSVIRRAGHQIESQYKQRYHPTDALLLDGGLTAAKKILFVPWKTDIESRETIQTEKSLSDLVKWCIQQGYQRKMKSISFPPIGTGQLGLDPAFVCEAMINAASDCLHQYKIDVIFVIYPSTQINNNHQNDDDECYQVFRIYLDSLCEQIKPNQLSKPYIDNQTNILNSSDTQIEFIRRNIQGKRVLTLSNSSNMIEDHNLLIKSLENLLYEKSFDLSYIEPSLIDKIDLLIDICFKYNVFPCIDYSKNELKVSGDRDSCFQCLFNIRQNKKVYQYSYVLTENGEKSDEIKFNSFISLKIDEAFALEESNVSIEDDNQMIFNIDLNKLQVEINRRKQSAFLVKKEINVNSKVKIPSSWSSSFSTISIIEVNKSLYQSLECYRDFYETMSNDVWIIERIDSIENYPLYIQFINNNKNETKLYYHGSSYSSVQSIIHYGLHSSNSSNYGDQFGNGSICLTRDVLNSHLYGTRRSTDGKHYLFAVQLAKYDRNNDFVLLTNDDAYLALPTHLIVYQRRKQFL
ncbi:unnamed protein product [Rotaria sordida]|uniref:Macro domain-containing protein n=1 Tax=Rotaria sordida TaxID=392033 RepID=A0A814LIS9_9BILA|nr:unnamed protein product [Rotaria sordida]CAF1009633.1 unnamed protein product [Rotaria sordida]CAF1066766.1 unnamed protein product [Rotaria sordida]CAF3589293.1 unnamed protein product [Rotaria sordida]